MSRYGWGRCRVEVPSNPLESELDALRAAAALVAHGASPRVVLDTVARHVASAVGANYLEILQFVDGTHPNVVAAWSDGKNTIVDLNRWLLADDDVATRLVETRAPTRVETGEIVSDATSVVTRKRFAIRCSVGVPVVMDDQIIGALFVHSATGTSLPPETESRLTGFTDLIAQSGLCGCRHPLLPSPAWTGGRPPALCRTRGAPQRDPADPGPGRDPGRLSGRQLSCH